VLKQISVYLLTLVLLSLLCGVFSYVIYLKFFSTPLDRLSFGGAFGGAFVLLFFTYDIYLLIFNQVKYSLIVQAILCSFFEIALWSVLIIAFAGFESRSIYINSITVGIFSAFIPYLHRFLSSKLEFLDNYNM